MSSKNTYQSFQNSSEKVQAYALKLRSENLFILTPEIISTNAILLLVLVLIITTAALNA